ncbi:MAG: fused response regulator/phosphatase [Planctomycetes bacterium]|nr:fused response regulator/phosphatase [Planctomycetota bacterium]
MAAAVRNALIAEDSRIQAKFLEQVLVRAGFAVRVALDGEAALQLAREAKPDVVISDIEMPRMTGYELCRSLKQSPQLRDVPVVLLSTLADAEDIIRGLDAGADNYVTKPYDPKFLVARVESLLQTPLTFAEDDLLELSVTLGGRRYQVKSGRQQALNLLVSTFENAVEKNRDLHRSNEQLTLAKEKLAQTNTQLESLNARLTHTNDRMTRDLHAAARVQRSLLPEGNLETPSVRTAWKYTPCDELAGDFLNYFMLDDRHLAMFVVDVSGHGTPSSLLAVAVGRLLTPNASATSLLVRNDPFTGRPVVTPPAVVVDELNRRFQMSMQGELYFTMAYGVLDLQTGELQYVSAGHPPMVHMSGADASFLPNTNFSVGWIDDVEFEADRVILRPGDRLFIYSDGVTEAFQGMDQSQYGDDRLLNMLRAQSSLPITESVNNLFESVITWCQPGSPVDDVSILGCEFGPGRADSSDRPSG